MIKSPIITPNVLIGYETEDMDDILEKRRKGITKVEEYSFADMIADLRMTESLIASTGYNILTFEHSFNFDGKKEAPIYKVKCVDLDDKALDKFLDFTILPNDDDLDIQFCSTATGRKTFTSTTPARPKSVDEFKALMSLDDSDKVSFKVNYMPPMTAVWIMYGQGENPANWGGPYLGYITALSLKYDSGNVREYSLTITPTLTRADDTQTNTAISNTAPFVTEIPMSRTGVSNGEVLRWLEPLLDSYFRDSLGMENVLIVLPNLSEMLKPVFEKIKAPIEKFIKDHSLGAKMAGRVEPVGATFGVDVDREVWRVIMGVMGIQTGEIPIVQRVDTPEPFKGFSIKGGPFEYPAGTTVGTNLKADLSLGRGVLAGVNPYDYRQWETLKADIQELVNKKIPTYLGLSDKTEFSFYEESEEFEGLEIALEETGRNFVFRISDTSENRDIQKFLSKFFAGLQILLPSYYLGEPYWAYESNKLIIDYWKSLTVAPTAASIAAGDSTRKPAFYIANDEESVLVVGDSKTIHNYLYGEIYGYKYLLANTSHPGTHPSKANQLRQIKNALEEYISVAEKTLPTGEGSVFSFWTAINEESYQKFFFDTFTNLQQTTDNMLAQGFKWTEDAALLFQALLRNMTAEFRSGYKDSNIISFEQDISKYILANIYRISKSSALKDLLE